MKLTLTIEGPMLTGEKLGKFIREAIPGVEFESAEFGKITGNAPNGTTVTIEIDADTDEIMEVIV